ncbi:MAG: recombinase family protein [Candidatus Babeliales bacterium]|nr:recombinase family protein [Candidatus Babeliales bacterium]
MKAILIARVSTEEQKEAGNSLPAQIARLERYCQMKGFRVLQSFSFDESAYTDQRGDFDRIIEFINEQKEKVVVCCDKVDRLSRNLFDKRISLLYEKALKDDIELHFVSDGQIVNSQISAVEKFNFGISLGLAKYYSDAISDNIKRANEQKLRKGELPGRAPYGYKNIITPDGKKDIVVSEYEALIVKKTYELYATATYSIEAVRQKIKDDYGVAWSQGIADFILRLHFYYGVMKRNDKLYPHRYPPIITKDLYDKVQQVKANFNKKPVKLTGMTYIYRGLLRCAQCDLAITAEKHKGFVYYHCTQYYGKHDAKWFREEEITEQIGKVFKNLQMPKEIAEQIKDAINETNNQKIDFQNKQLAELNKEHKKLTTMLENLYLDKLQGRITESAYDKFNTQFREQLESVNSKIYRLEEVDNNYYIMTNQLLKLSSRAYELFLSSEVDEKRQLISLILSNLKVDGENIVYDVVKPFDMIMKSNDQLLWCAR